jgi:hypothetical protein
MGAVEDVMYGDTPNICPIAVGGERALSLAKGPRCPQFAQETRDSAPVLRLVRGLGKGYAKTKVMRLSRARNLPRFECKTNRATPRQTRPFATFHRQMAVFSEQVREIPTKYKMLWFVVDTYHGQRYFFICGLKRIVTRIPAEMGTGEPRWVLKLAAFIIPVFRSFSTSCR